MAGRRKKSKTQADDMEIDPLPTIPEVPETPVEEPAEVPADVPADVPVEVPAEVPVEVPEVPSPDAELKKIVALKEERVLLLEEISATKQKWKELTLKLKLLDQTILS